MIEGLEQHVPSDAELAAEILAIEEKRLSLGKLFQLLPGGSLRAGLVMPPGEEAEPQLIAPELARTTSAIDRFIAVHGIDVSDVEEWQAARNDPDQLTKIGATFHLTRVMLRTVYPDMRRDGFTMEELTDDVPPPREIPVAS